MALQSPQRHGVCVTVHTEVAGIVRVDSGGGCSVSLPFDPALPSLCAA